MPSKLPTAYTVAMTALVIGKQHLVSVVIPIQPPVSAPTPFLACRLNNRRTRHQFAHYWARVMGRRQIIVHSPGEMVFVPIAPLPDGRYNGIGRLVVNPGNGRLFQTLLWAAGLG